MNALGLLLLIDAYPLWLARRANVSTSLSHAVHWSVVAWLAWLATVGVSLCAGPQVERSMAFLALCLTGCAGVAVLGARRPGVQAWTFVILGLLVVLALPLLEGLDRLRGSPLRVLFLCTTLAVTVLNYLPTRLAPAALLVGVGILPDLLRITGPEAWTSWLEQWQPWGWTALAMAPWAGWLALRWRAPSRMEFDCVWLDFRDRFGFVWGQRLRDQFNRAVANTGWHVHLGWFGLRFGSDSSEADAGELLRLLQSLLKRFGSDARAAHEVSGN